MNAAAKAALSHIQDSLAAGRYFLTPHFRQRLAERGILWADILCVFDCPTAASPGGPERLGRPKWNIARHAADGLAIELVCVLETDANGRSTVLITVYFKRQRL